MSNAFEEVLSIRDKPLADGEAAITGRDPVHQTRFKVAETLAAVHAGIGVAVSDIWELKTGRRQKTRIDVRHAAAAAKSAYYLQRPDANGVFQDVVNPEHEHMRRMTPPWPTRDGPWFLPHFGLPNLRARVLKVLDCEPTPEAVGKAVARWNALDLEAVIDEARACGGMVRSHCEWITTPHGAALARKPIVEIIKIGDSDAQPLPKSERPLDGLRVLDLTRIFAGRMSARTLAEHGADVASLLARIDRLLAQIAARDGRRLERELEQLLARKPTDAEGRKLRDAVYLDCRDKLFAFLKRRDAEPTNNESERALRPSVTFRKVTNGVPLRVGAQAYAALCSIVETGRRNGRSALTAIRDAPAAPAVGAPRP